MNRWNDAAQKSSSKLRKSNPRKLFLKASQSTMLLEKYHNSELVLRRTQMFMAAGKLRKHEVWSK